MPIDLTSLSIHARRLEKTSLPALEQTDPARFARYTRRAGGLTFDFSRQLVDDNSLQALMRAALDAGIANSWRTFDAGGIVNLSEDRAATHVQARAQTGWISALRDAAGHAGRNIDHIIHIGIGGSHAGVQMAAQALAPQDNIKRPDIFFLTSCDGHHLERVLAACAPARTLVCVASKTFGTAEILMNWDAVRAWLGEFAMDHAFALTAMPQAAKQAGFNDAHILPFPVTIGGRFSLWSSVSFPLAVLLGADTIDQMCQGAHAMDQHVSSTVNTPDACLPALHAAIAFWNRAVRGCAAQAVVPYDSRLKDFPAYLQQLVMESLGKTRDAHGQDTALPTAPVVFGGTGTDAQHSFFQMLHQGSDIVPVDFIGVRTPGHAYPDMHRTLNANLIAQADSLMRGKSPDFPGNRPSSLIWADRLDGAAFGALVAFYEHSVYFQGVLWGLNPFDQPGVELGKKAALPLAQAIKTGITEGLPPSAKALVDTAQNAKDL